MRNRLLIRLFIPNRVPHWYHPGVSKQIAVRLPDAEILAGSEGDSDLDELAEFAATVSMDDLE